LPQIKAASWRDFTTSLQPAVLSVAVNQPGQARDREDEEEMTWLSGHQFRSNEMGHRLSTLAYDLANRSRRLAPLTENS